MVTKIYFRDLPPRFHLDHNKTINPPGEGKTVMLSQGTIKVVIGTKTVTDAKDLSTVDLQVIDIGGTLYVHQLQNKNPPEYVRMKVVAGSIFGPATGPQVAFVGHLRIEKRIDSATTSAHCTSHQLDFGSMGHVGMGDLGVGLMRWRFDVRPEQHHLFAKDPRRGFAFGTSPHSGDLLLSLGEYRSIGGTGNREPMFLRSGPYILRIEPGFEAAFEFNEAIAQPVKLIWPTALAATIKFTEPSLRWLLGSKDEAHIYLRRLDFGGNWITATRFAGFEVGLRIGPFANGEAAATHLYGPSVRFAWHTQWPANSGDYDGPANHFVYSDPGALDHRPSNPDFREELYRGVWIGNLTDRAGGPARFDATLAALSKSPGSRTVTFRAGRQFDGKVTILAPKFHVTGIPSRMIQIPVERTAFLSITAVDRPSASPVEFEFAFDYDRPDPAGRVEFKSALLKASPFDASAALGEAAFDYWTLKPPAGTNCWLAYDKGGAAIPDDFAEGWTTLGTTVFVLAGGANGAIQIGFGASDQSTLETDPLVGLRYKTIAARLAYSNPQRAALTDLADPKTITIDKVAIDSSTPLVWLVRNNGVGDIVYRCQYGHSGADVEAKRLIDKLAGAGAVDEVFLKLELGLQAALKLPKQGAEPGPHTYWNALARRARSDAKPGLVMDLSGEEDIHPWAGLGWTEAAWKRFQAADDRLWPAFGRQYPIGFDPSRGGWRGHLLRDFLIAFPAKVKKTVAKFKPALKLYEQLEQSMVIDYAWNDSRGWTFHAGFAGPGPVTFFRLPGVVSFDLVDMQVAVAGGRLSRAHGRVAIELPFLSKSDARPPGAPIRNKSKGSRAVVDTFRVDLGVTFADLGDGLAFQSAFLERPEEQRLAKFRDPVPGVEKLEVVRVRTDLKTLSLVGILTLSPDVDTLLNLGKTLEVELVIPLGDAEGFTLEGRLPAEKAGTVGGWGIVVRSLKLAFGPNSPKALEFTGSINLAVDGFVSFGFVARFDGSGSTFTITGFKGKLAIGGFGIQLNLELEEKKGSKYFIGTASLLSPLVGEIATQLKIGEQGGDSYWIGAIRKGDSNTQLDFAKFGSLDDRTLIFGRRIDRGDAHQGKLEAALLNPSGSKVFDATDRDDDDLSWLHEWNYRKDIDFLIGASGFLGLDRMFLAKGGKRTGLMLTSGGYFRVEAHSKFFGTIDVDYDLTLDTARKFIFAGFHAPKFKTEGGLEVSGGYVGLGLGYGDHKEFALTVGWPFPTFDPGDGEPDWSRAVTVHWDGAFPLNTFAGGAMVHIAKDIVRLGIAIRGGWTWSYEASAWKLEAKAELGIMLGGVLYFEFGKLGRPLDVPSLLSNQLLSPTPLALPTGPQTESLRQIAELSLLIDGALKEIAAVDVKIVVGLYLDIWGEARVRFMGITLVGVRIDAHAKVAMKYKNGLIYYAGAKARFSVTVKIGCTEYRQSASFNVTYIDKPEPQRFGEVGTSLVSGLSPVTISPPVERRSLPNPEQVA